MKKLKRIFGKILYFFAKRMPTSYSGIKMGQTALRRLSARLMLEKCGSNVNVEQGAKFSCAVELGDNSGIGVNARLTGKVVIGKNVMMGPEVSIYVKNHAFSRTDIPMNKQGFTEEKPVYISDDVWIGERVIILPGVSVGQGAVIGAGAIVTKDVPEYAVVGGNPAKVIKMRK